MTEQPPPFEPYPTAPPTRRGELAPSRAGDESMAWVLWGLLLVGCLVTFVVMLLLALVVGVGCSSGGTGGEVCSGSAADVAQAGYVGTWFAMASAVVVSLIMIIVSNARRGLAWVWPAGAILVVLVSFLVWKVAYDLAV